MFELILHDYGYEEEYVIAEYETEEEAILAREEKVRQLNWIPNNTDIVWCYSVKPSFNAQS